MARWTNSIVSAAQHQMSFEVVYGQTVTVGTHIVIRIVLAKARTHHWVVLRKFVMQATPKLPMKRKSINCRKLRPQSVVDSVEGIAADDIPDLLPKGSESIICFTADSLPNLSPTSEKLEHLGKARPKRPKTHAPTRPCLQASESREPPLAEGLDCFFKRHPSTSTPTLSPDSEDVGLKSDSSTSASSSILITESKPLEKSPSDNKETEKRSFMKGISSLFSRASSSSSESVVVQKSKESKDIGSSVMSTSLSAYSSVKSRHDIDVHDKENGG
ncbi:hypothetical protein HPB51_020431 [Rhipicephalus microplus]|uniref:CARMIL C-terminal domain-containing protein n=1 Tax=Rhipicephalus microplus TaxID=6941 RepID=A0A9J6DCB3_RHIMP|nr:hypothetical protein HPB51_020431 [Rhipicephalus microplus]